MATPCRILLVEDDPDQASLFAQVLSMMGYEVATVPDAESALGQLTATSYDLVLVDWDLPGMKGDTLISQVKSEHPDLPMALISNHAHVDEAARACGADASFRKSEGIIPLRRLVTELLSA